MILRFKGQQEIVLEPVAAMRLWANLSCKGRDVMRNAVLFQLTMNVSHKVVSRV
jgi:hypothetical protein